MLKKAIVLFVTLLMVLAFVSPAQAVTFGQPDTGNQYPYVGTLLFETPTGFYSCTGTLIAPDVMVTAGHCTEEGGVPNLNTWVSFDQNIVLPRFETRAELRRYLNKNWITATAIPHPQFDDFATWPDTYDVGVLLLDESVDLNTYGVLAPIGFLDTAIKGKQQNYYTAVGYGMQGFIKPFYSDDWERYYGTVKLLELNSAWTGNDASAKFSNNPGTGGGTCFGDSGGPIFYQDTNTIVAVVSWGNTPCIGVDFQYRLDTTIAANFVNSYLK